MDAGVGHSRLLKFIVKNKPEMERHSLKIEDLGSGIESEVPRQQQLRPEPLEPLETQNEETTEWPVLVDMIQKPVYMGLQSAVLLNQPIRAPKLTFEVERPAGPQSREHSGEDKPVEDQPPTRIPVSRFKPAVELVQRKRRESEKRQAPEKPRRSSIHKSRVPVSRKKSTDNDTDVAAEKGPINKTSDGAPRSIDRKPIRKDRIPVMKKDHYKIVKTDEKKPETLNTEPAAEQEPVKTDPKEKLDDEFDKLYDEIVDTEVTSLPDEILEAKLKDPEKLESKFEEIVHNYEDEREQVKIEPVDKARYSKIPLLRRRSSQDIKVPKQLKIDDKTIKNNDEKNKNVNVTSIDDGSNPNDVADDNNVMSLENTEDENVQDDPIEINNHDANVIINHYPSLAHDFNTVPTPEAERVKVGIFGMSTRDIPINNTNENTEVSTPILETVKLGVIDIPAEDSLESSSYVETEAESFNKTEIPTNKEQNDKVVSLVEPELDKDVEYDMGTQNQNNVVLDVREEITTPIEHDDNTAQKENHVTKQNDVPLNKPEDELKSFSLLQKVGVEDRTKSRYINKPTNKNGDTNINEEKPSRGKVNSILKRLNSQEPPSDDFSNNALKKEEIHGLKPAERVPRNKSVLSKIAMFERAEPGPIEKKPVHRYFKPKRTTSDDIRHSPKIVQEVLKPRGEQTNKHTIITIDISKPVEVITNNEEQVTIVEDLTENTIEFENLDDIKLNGAETVQTRLKSDTHETLSREDNRLYVAEPKESKRKISATRDKLLDDEETVSDVESKERITHLTVLGNHEPKDTRKISVTRNQILDDVDAIESNDSETNPNQGIHHLSRNISVTRDKILDDNIHTPNTEKNYVNDQNGSINPRGNDERPKYIKSNDSKLYNKLYNKLDDIYNNYKKTRVKDYEPKHTHKREVEDGENIESIKNNLYKKRDEAEKWKSTDALADFVPVKVKINRLTSCDDSMKKAKSTTDLDIGDIVKGKVKSMIVRMNSVDVREKDVVDVINDRERPRKRSVSEKIALFERKLIPVAMEGTVDMGRALNADTAANSIDIHDKNVTKKLDPVTKPNDLNVTNKPNDLTNATNVDVKTEVSAVDIAAKIKELQEAKKKYGSVEMATIELNDGRKMPVMALGTALLDPRLTKHIVAAAIDLGFRAIDTAYIYGSEREVGEGIRMKIQDGTVKREDLFIMSKLWSTFHDPELVEGACRASLAALGLDYIDLFMIHNPMSFKEGGDPIPKIANVIQFSSFEYLDAWFAMEELVAKGLVRSLGLSNFNSQQVTRVLEKGRIKPVVNQVECHPYLNQVQLSEFCEARNVRMSCFGVLGSKGTPAEYRHYSLSVIDDSTVQMLAAGLNVTPAQVLIRYQIDRGHSVVVKASSAAHLAENVRALQLTLRPGDLSSLNNLNRNGRTFTFQGMGDTHRNYPFTIAF